MTHLPSLPKGRLIDVFKAYAKIAAPLHEFAHELMQDPSPLSEGERELIAAFVSARNRCAVCRAAHTGVARRHGVEPARVDDLLDDIGTARVTDRLKPVLRYVAKLSDAPASVGRADAQAILEAGWDERAVVHAALVCGFFNLMNRWVDGIGIEPDEKTAEMAADQLHDRGYRAIAAMLGGGGGA